MGKFDSKITFDTNIRSFDLIRFKNEGIVPCYYDKKTLELVEFKTPLPLNGRDVPRQVFLLTQEQYDKVLKLSEQIKELIKLELKKVETLKSLVPATMAELAKREK